MTRTPTEPLRCTCGCEDFRLINQGRDPHERDMVWECDECESIWFDADDAAKAVAEQEAKEAEKEEQAQ